MKNSIKDKYGVKINDHDVIRFTNSCNHYWEKGKEYIGEVLHIESHSFIVKVDHLNYNSVKYNSGVVKNTECEVLGLPYWDSFSFIPTKWEDSMNSLVRQFVYRYCDIEENTMGISNPLYKVNDPMVENHKNGKMFSIRFDESTYQYELTGPEKKQNVYNSFPFNGNLKSQTFEFSQRDNRHELNMEYVVDNGGHGVMISVYMTNEELKEQLDYEISCIKSNIKKEQRKLLELK